MQELSKIVGSALTIAFLGDCPEGSLPPAQPPAKYYFSKPRDIALVRKPLSFNKLKLALKKRRLLPEASI